MYKLHLVGVQEFKLDKGGIVRPGNYILFYGKRKRKLSDGNSMFNTIQNGTRS